MALCSTLFLALALVPLVTGHGTVTKPAMRANPSKGRYCPWCQGSQSKCDPTARVRCAPPSPCWGGIPGTMVSKQFFGKWKDLAAPDGTPWIDNGEELGGSQGAVPVHCPGDVIPVHTFVKADHNGVYRWESQLASPGRETEIAFVNFTSWKSVNQDPDADFYAADGKTKLTPGRCYKPGKCTTWSSKCSHCRNDAFSKTSLSLPINMPAGATVLRWFWYGAMETNGERVMGPEHSLFVNCKDITIGTAEQCSGNFSSPTSLVLRRPERNSSHDVLV